jgi:hypothetical protein
VAGINHRKAGSEESDKRRLRSLQMKTGLIIAVDGHFLQITVPRFARVEAEFFA